MGMESQPILESNLPPSGLCNAVVLAKPYAPFITRWLDQYKTFDPSSWAGHSVTLPWVSTTTLTHLIYKTLNWLEYLGTNRNWLKNIQTRLQFWTNTRSFGLSGACIRKPFINSLDFSDSCKMLENRHEDHLNLIHRSSSYQFSQPPSGSRSLSALLSGSQFTYHLWESFAHERYLTYYTPDLIHGELPREVIGTEGEGVLKQLGESSFAKEARKWVREGFRQRWRRAKRAGVAWARPRRGRLPRINCRTCKKTVMSFGNFCQTFYGRFRDCTLFPFLCFWISRLTTSPGYALEPLSMEPDETSSDFTMVFARDLSSLPEVATQIDEAQRVSYSRGKKEEKKEKKKEDERKRTETDPQDFVIVLDNRFPSIVHHLEIVDKPQPNWRLRGNRLLFASLSSRSHQQEDRTDLFNCNAWSWWLIIRDQRFRQTIPSVVQPLRHLPR